MNRRREELEWSWRTGGTIKEGVKRVKKEKEEEEEERGFTQLARIKEDVEGE